jgi:hypothetical protein
VDRLTEVFTPASSNGAVPNTSIDYTSFDGLGRASASGQTIGSTAYTFGSYSYNWQDAVSSVTYPSERVVSYNFDNS